jgi:hypothetical protein
MNIKYYTDLIQIINYHKALFEENSKLEKLRYTNQKENILDTYQFFTSIDKHFQLNLLDKLFLDILSLLQLSNKFKKHNGKFYNSLDLDIDFDDFLIEIKKEEKVIKQVMSNIINTKLYYLDFLMWHKARQSKIINKFLEDNLDIQIYHSEDFAKVFSIPKHIRENFKYNEKIEYTKNEILMINSLNNEIKADKNQLIQNLIKSKNKFNFFDDIEDFEIPKIIKNLRIFTYQTGDTIIRQGAKDLEIYLLLAGECGVRVDGKEIGTIKAGETFGELTPFSGIPRSAQIVANIPSKLISFNIAFELAEDESKAFLKLYKNIVDILVLKLIETNKKI